MSSEAARSIAGVSNSAIVLSSLVTAAGLAIIIGPGYLNPLRFGPFFIAIGTIGFFVPGLLGVVGGLFLKRERANWARTCAAIGVALQFLVACIGLIAQFNYSPISAVPVVLCAVWMIAAAIVFWRLIRLSPAIRTDTLAVGFSVDASIPTATPAPSDQIDNVRAK